MTPIRLNDTDRDLALSSLPNWTFDASRDALHRQLRFEDFASALAAMVRIGVVADRADHHPEWSNVYDRIDIWLTTHDANGVSEKDFALAKAIDLMY